MRKLFDILAVILTATALNSLSAAHAQTPNAKSGAATVSEDGEARADSGAAAGGARTPASSLPDGGDPEDPNLRRKPDGALMNDGRDPIIPGRPSSHCCSAQLTPGSFIDEEELSISEDARGGTEKSSPRTRGGKSGKVD